MKKTILAITVLITTLTIPQVASAVMIVDSLGNTAPGFTDGSVPGAVAVAAAQAGQPAPVFNQALGSDVLSNAAGVWTHTYGAIGDPILGATLDIGIVDHDSAAAGDQVLLFSADGSDLTASMNTLFNGTGGSNGEYNVYQVDLAGILGSLADGSASFELNLNGPGLQTCLIFLPGCDPANPTTETNFNGANYIFSTLTIEVQDPIVQPAPEPSTVVLLGLGLLGLGVRRARSG